jgi:glycosyltransferase involved in cell wall biosynthesis
VGYRNPVPASSLAAHPPALASVIVPVLNAEAHVAEQLAALAAQTYAGDWELVVADNGCTDRTIAIVESWAAKLPALTIADATSRRGLNHARNAGAAAARGELLVFCDADDVATPGWLDAMVTAARDAELVGGRLEFESLNDPVVRAWRPKAGVMTALVRDHRFLPYAPGGNMAVWARVAREIGWDEAFTFGSSDHGFAWHAQLAGHRIAFAPDAVIQQRFRRTMLATARQFYRYGRSGPQLYSAFREHGMPPPDNRDALRRWRKLARTLPDLFASRELRGSWVRTAAFRVGRLVGSARARVLCL